ncbi:MAG: hypothetical protein U0324_04605 [Polyangiales bacterium]
MADTYIDYDETQIYGDYAIDQIARHLMGHFREFDPALHYVAVALRLAGDQVASQLAAARAADPSLHALVAAHEGPQRAARDVLQRFAHHLESHRAGEVPFERFFVDAPNTLARRGPVRLLAALDHVLGTLDEHAASVREAPHWREELASARAAMSSAVADDRRLRATDVSTPELIVAREHWLAVYDAAKHLVSAALTLGGSNLPLDEVFDDLAATHRAEGAYDDIVPGEAVAS